MFLVTGNNCSHAILTVQTSRTHLLQGLHELFYRDGAAQQRLQNLAVWNVFICTLSLLTTCGLRGPGRGLVQKNRDLIQNQAHHHPPAAEVRAGHAENHSEPTLPSGTSSLTEAPGPGGIRVQQVSGHLHSGSLLAGGSIWRSSTSELMPTSHIASTPSFASYLLLKLFLI